MPEGRIAVALGALTAHARMLRRVHDATCPGAVANLKPVQRVCPVCRAAAQGEAGETD